jgi:hypothetical protein
VSHAGVLRQGAGLRFRCVDRGSASTLLVVPRVKVIRISYYWYTR